MLRNFWASAALLVIVGCSRGPSEDQLRGKWQNQHLAAKQPGIVSIEFLPQNTVTIGAVDALAAAGWHPPTTSTGRYEIIAPNKLKISEDLGSVVLDYRVDGTHLTLSGQGLAQLLGKDEPPQALEKTGQ
jgi:hypothetical protein